MDDLIEIKEEFHRRDFNQEPGPGMVGKQRLSSSLGRPIDTKINPNSSSSITVADSASSSIIFNLPKSGYLASGHSGCMGAFEATFTPDVACLMEAYGSIIRFDQDYNGSRVTSKYNHAYRAACAEVLDTPLPNLMSEGAQYGLSCQANQYEPFTNSTSTTVSLSTSGATAATNPAYVSTAGKTFLIPFKILADGVLADPDSIFPIAHLTSNQIEISFRASNLWTSNVSSTPGSVVVTVSNPILYISRCDISNEMNRYYMSLLAEGRLAVHTIVKTTQNLSQAISTNTTAANYRFTGLPSVIQQLEFFIEAPAGAGNALCAYKALTTPDCGITSYQVFLDSVALTDKPVSVTKGEAYATYQNCRYARLRAQKDTQRLAPSVLSPFTHSGIGRTVAGHYPSADTDATGDNITWNSGFRMCANLASVNSSLYSGKKGAPVDVQINTGAGTSTYITGASTANTITSVQMIMVCHAQARLILGFGTCFPEM